MKLFTTASIFWIVAAGGWGIASAAESSAATASAKLANAKGEQVGEATLTETPSGLLIRLALQANPPGLAPGEHGFHVHEVGKCEPPFKSAGGHFNPGKKKHGYHAKDGAHAGDLPNIHIPSSGGLTVEFLVPGLALTRGKNALLDADGSALVIHARGDDYRSDPAGESGDRVACGVVMKAGL
ncbi:MAG TPA: superoxide dismutase family protein [candidate division Zixibacteria bacterium]|nr:superoxide dismutase family protein [candidate division Zixibacteria bacterium]